MTEKTASADHCDMRGMLSFMVLWLLSAKPMYGQELASEIGKRRGDKPNPGTIYPALKDMTKRGLIRGELQGRSTVYELTPAGKASLSEALDYFENAFGEIFRSAAKVRKKLQIQD